jgi:mRNA interferase MazF
VTVIRRGDVFLVTSFPRQGENAISDCPVIVVSRDAINRNSPVVLIVPVKEKRSKTPLYPSQVEIRAHDGGIEKDSIVMGEQVRAIPISHLTKQLGNLAPSTMVRIGAALKIALDLQ